MSNEAPTDSRALKTREALLHAGVRVFSELGFDAASTRHLASKAGVNLAAIPYHFENKKGLYLAVAEYVAERIGARLLPLVETILSQIDTPGFDDAAARNALSQIFTNMAHLLMGAREADAWAGFILREQAQPTEAFDVIYDRTMGRVIEVIALLIGRLTDTDRDDPRTRLRAITIMGQLLVFRTSRAGVLRTMGWRAYSPEHVQQLLTLIENQVDAILRSTNA